MEAKIHRYEIHGTFILFSDPLVSIWYFINNCSVGTSQYVSVMHCPEFVLHLSNDLNEVA